MLQVEKGIHPIALEEQKGGLTGKKGGASACQNKKMGGKEAGTKKKKKKKPWHKMTVTSAFLR